jgi:hypothetical protein
VGVARLLALVAFYLGTPVRAQLAGAEYRGPQAEALCQKDDNVALVRFIPSSDYDRVKRRLPAHVDDGLSASRAPPHSDCTMANGWTIRVRIGEEQASPYGEGGANPPAYFSLWIGQRKIISRKEWKPGYASWSDPWLIGVAIRPDRLTFCSVAGGADAPAQGAISCRNERFRLDRYKIDQVEYASPGSRSAVGTILLGRGSSEPRVCRDFLRSVHNDLDRLREGEDVAKVFKPVDTPASRSISVGTVEIADVDGPRLSGVE